MERFLAELIGTMMLVFFGDSIVASCVLKKSKSYNAGWIALLFNNINVYQNRLYSQSL